MRAGAKRTCEYVDLVNSDDEEAEEEDRRGGSDSDSDAESENSAKFTDDEEGEYSGSESESDADMDEDDEPVMPTKTNTKSTTSSPSKLVPSKIARVGELPDNRLNNAAPHSSSPKDGTFDRISKTYALAQNAGTEEEALHAHRLLAKLLATHNIELSELQKEAQAEGKKTPSITDNRGEAVVEIIPNPDCIRAITTIKAEHWAGELARHVADLFHVRVLEGYGRRGEPILRYYFYGLTENIITAAQLFAICYNQASSWAYVMLGRREITGKRSVRSYCSGFAEAIHDSVKAHLELERNAAAGDKVAEYQEGGDLQLAVWKSTGDYEQFRAMAKLACDLAISDCKVKAVPRTTSQLVDSSAFDKGRRDGKTVNLKKQRTE